MGDNCMDQSLNNGEIAGLISVNIRKSLILLITKSVLGSRLVVKEGVRAVWYSKQELNVSILLDLSLCCWWVLVTC